MALGYGGSLRGGGPRVVVVMMMMMMQRFLLHIRWRGKMDGHRHICHPCSPLRHGHGHGHGDGHGYGHGDGHGDGHGHGDGDGGVECPILPSPSPSFQRQELLQSLICRHDLDAARQLLLSNRPASDAVDWTSVISAFVRCGRHNRAFALFRQMQECPSGPAPDRVTFLALLRACLSGRFRSKGKELHACLLDGDNGDDAHGLASDVLAQTALVDMYAKCDNLRDAVRAFDRMRVKTLLSWTAVIAGCARHGRNKEAFCFFLRMLREREGPPDQVVVATVLGTCPGQSAHARGKIIHAHVVDKNLDSNEDVLSGLVSMYGTCRNHKDSRRIRERMINRNAPSQ